MARTDAARLKAFLQTLPQTDRYILLLTYADGLSAAEVAMVLDLPETTVHSRFEVLRREAESVLREVATAAVSEAMDDAAPVAIVAS